MSPHRAWCPQGHNVSSDIPSFLWGTPDTGEKQPFKLRTEVVLGKGTWMGGPGESHGPFPGLDSIPHSYVSSQKLEMGPNLKTGSLQK